MQLTCKLPTRYIKIQPLVFNPEEKHIDLFVFFFPFYLKKIFQKQKRKSCTSRLFSLVTLPVKLWCLQAVVERHQRNHQNSHAVRVLALRWYLLVWLVLADPHHPPLHRLYESSLDQAAESILWLCSPFCMWHIHLTLGMHFYSSPSSF